MRVLYPERIDLPERLLRGEAVDHHGTLRDTYLYAITRGGE